MDHAQRASDLGAILRVERLVDALARTGDGTCGVRRLRAPG
jgi:hypothetical protein